MNIKDVRLKQKVTYLGEIYTVYAIHSRTHGHAVTLKSSSDILVESVSPVAIMPVEQDMDLDRAFDILDRSDTLENLRQHSDVLRDQIDALVSVVNYAEKVYDLSV